jgi:glycosyltransferase involved in cell wall biosynthesis
MNLVSNQPLRVALVGPYPLDPQQVHGGIQAVVKIIVQELSQDPDLELHVITINFGERQQPVVAHPNLRVHVRTAKQGLSQFCFYRWEQEWLRKTVQQIQPQIVHVHGTNFYGSAACHWSFPTLFTVHGVLEREGQIDFGEVDPFYRIYRTLKGYFNAAFERKTLNHAQYVTTISPYVTQILTAQYPHIRQTFAIDNPIQEAYFQLPNQTVPNRILFAGSITIRKGVLMLLKAIAQVREVYPDLQLHIAGGVEQAEYDGLLQSFVREHQLEPQVLFLGHLSEPEMLREFSECRLLVLPSQEDVSPMVIEQAMAAGKTVVATTVGGIPDMVDHGQTGLLVSFGDVQALSQAIMNLLANPQEYDRLSQNARAIALARFQAKPICAKLLESYYQVIQAHGIT